MTKRDLAIVGGGLAGGLIALALHRRRPDMGVKLIETGAALGGNHTWSFHDTDLGADAHELVSPLITYRWKGQEVAFPGMFRRLSTGYNSIASAKFHDVLTEILGGAIELNSAAISLTPTSVCYARGAEKAFEAVIDCRGAQSCRNLTLGYQKFLGKVVRLSEPHGLDRPIIMDATVSQVDGYRFVYVLPFDDDTALIEDTRYADDPDLSAESLRLAIDAYAEAKGWRISETLREEEGILPIALAGDIEAFWNESSGDVQGPVPRAGMRAGLFHPLTGYSLPDAAALALKIAAAPDLSAPSLYALTRSYSVGMWRKRAFYRLLTRMLFRAAAPERRYRVLERFYKLPQGLIERFYAGRSTAGDKFRLLAGKPPVPILDALRVLPEASVISPQKRKLAG